MRGTKVVLGGGIGDEKAQPQTQGSAKKGKREKKWSPQTRKTVKNRLVLFALGKIDFSSISKNLSNTLYEYYKIFTFFSQFFIGIPILASTLTLMTHRHQIVMQTLKDQKLYSKQVAV